MIIDQPAFEASQAFRALDQLGIELSADTQRLAKRLNILRENPPQPAPFNRVAHLIADDANDKAISQAVIEHLGTNHLIQQTVLAADILGGRVLDAILDDAPRIHAELRVTADELIDRLHQAAALDLSVIELTKARRIDDAHLAATAESDAESLRTLYFVRDTYLTPPTARWCTGWHDCRTVKNPWDATYIGEHDETTWGTWQAAIRAGAQLWYPTVEEATAASQAHEPGDMLPPIDVHRSSTGMFTG